MLEQASDTGVLTPHVPNRMILRVPNEDSLECGVEVSSEVRHFVESQSHLVRQFTEGRCVLVRIEPMALLCCDDVWQSADVPCGNRQIAVVVFLHFGVSPSCPAVAVRPR